MRGRAYRRHQRHRARGRALRYLRWSRSPSPQWVNPNAVIRYAVDRVPCSCYMCGNPRHFTSAVTRQEVLAAL